MSLSEENLVIFTINGVWRYTVCNLHYTMKNPLTIYVFLSYPDVYGPELTQDYSIQLF